MLYTVFFNRIALFAFLTTAVLVATIDVATPMFVGEATWRLQERYFESGGNISTEELKSLYDNFSDEAKVREIINFIYFSILFVGIIFISAAFCRQSGVFVSLFASVVLIVFHLSVRHFMGANSLGPFHLHRYALLMAIPILVGAFRRIKEQHNG
jgi:hypothetical protein